MLNSGSVNDLHRIIIDDSASNMVKPTLNLNMMKVGKSAVGADLSSSGMCSPANDVLVSNLISRTHDH